MATLLNWPLIPQPSGPGVAVTAAALTASGISPLPTIPGSLIQNGAKLRLSANGEVTSSSATPTCVVGFYVMTLSGAISFGTVIAVTAALPISASAAAWPFILEYEGTFRTISSAAGPTLHGQGKCFWGANSGLGTALTVYPMPITQALRTVVTALDMRPGVQVDVGVTLSSTTGSPSVLVTDLWGEISG